MASLKDHVAHQPKIFNEFKRMEWREKIDAFILECTKENDEVCQLMLEYLIDRALQARDDRQAEIVNQEIDDILHGGKLLPWKH